MDADGNESFGLFAVNYDGSRARVLKEPVEAVKLVIRQSWFLDPLWDDPENILILDNERRLNDLDVLRLNTFTGETTRVELNDGRVDRWIPDGRGRIRLAVGHADSPGEDGVSKYLVREVRYRETEDSPWQVISRDGYYEHGFEPLGFAADDVHVWVSSNRDRKTSALYLMDPRTGELGKPVLEDDEYDVCSFDYLYGVWELCEPVVSPRSRQLLAVMRHRERPVIDAVEPGWARFQAMLDQALPDTFNEVVSISHDESRFVIRAWSDRTPGAYYLFDLDRGQLEFITDIRPKLDPDHLSPMEPIAFAARDGTEIHGYLTLPRGRSENLPLVLNPHGGPYGIRDKWTYNSEVQFLASRGYAVLQVNYRGSGGYGQAFRELGYRRWGLEMQDDLTDAVNWAVDQGIADPDRVAIYGGSYGGYAAMAGVTLTPELYRCAVNIVGVSDLPLLYNYDEDYLPLRAWFEETIGHPGRDRERFEVTSPLQNIDQVQVPVFVAHGKRDRRVPLAHATKLVNELEDYDIPHDVMIKANEGHGFRKPENRIEYYSRIADFLDQHMAPRPQKVSETQP